MMSSCLNCFFFRLFLLASFVHIASGLFMTFLLRSLKCSCPDTRIPGFPVFFDEGTGMFFFFNCTGSVLMC